MGVLLVAVPPFLSSYPLTLLTQALIFAIFAMSLDLLLGYTGLPSLGHAAYFGVAAYVVAIFTTEYQMGFWTCLHLALLAAIVTAAAFGLIAIRALGTYFLMITLALGMVVWGLAFRWVSLTKGDNGISGVPRPSLGLPWSFANQTAFYYLTLVTFLLALRAALPHRALALRDEPPGNPRERSGECEASATTSGSTSTWPSSWRGPSRGSRASCGLTTTASSAPWRSSSSRPWRPCSWWPWAGPGPSSARRWAPA